MEWGKRGKRRLEQFLAKMSVRSANLRCEIKLFWTNALLTKIWQHSQRLKLYLLSIETSESFNECEIFETEIKKETINARKLFIGICWTHLDIPRPRRGLRAASLKWQEIFCSVCRIQIRRRSHLQRTSSDVKTEVELLWKVWSDLTYYAPDVVPSRDVVRLTVAPTEVVREVVREPEEEGVVDQLYASIRQGILAKERNAIWLRNVRRKKFSVGISDWQEHKFKNCIKREPGNSVSCCAKEKIQI